VTKHVKALREAQGYIKGYMPLQTYRWNKINDAADRLELVERQNRVMRKALMELRTDVFSSSDDLDDPCSTYTEATARAALAECKAIAAKAQRKKRKK